MKLVNLKVSEYLEVLRSDAPAPGGGSVSALAGAQAMALVAMVCGLTIGNAKYQASEEVCKKAKTEAEALFEKFSVAFDKDTEAFHLVSDAYKMPKGTAEEKAARSAAIAAGTLAATKVPFGVMEMCCEGIQLIQKIAGKTNTNAASDLGVAIENLATGMKGAWLNVKINLPGIKDKAYAEKVLNEGQEMCTKCEALAAELFAQTEESL